MSFDTLAFYSKSDAPDYIKHRTDAEYHTMSLDELKSSGFWNRRLDKMLPLLPDNAWIAGGFLRAMIAGEDDRNGDIDFFFGNADAFNKMLAIIKAPSSEEKSVFGWYSIPQYDIPMKELRVIDCISDGLFRPNIQLVKLYWYDTPIHVIDNFDLSVCQIAIDKNRVYYAPSIFNDIKNKVINVHRNTGSSLTLLNRLLKYDAKGYHTPKEFFDKVEEEAIEVLKDPSKINEYFYMDKDDTKTHKRTASFLQRAWDYLEENPKSAEAYKIMIKNRARPLRKKIVYNGVY